MSSVVSVDQLTSLIDFMEAHPELALGYCSRTKEGRSLSRRLWEQCAETLNAISPNCTTKTAANWRLYFNEYKSKLLKKIKAQKAEYSATGGGPSKVITYTPLQNRLYDILGRDVGEPLLGVRHNPLLLLNNNASPAEPLPTINILGRDIGEPLLGVRHNPLSLLDNNASPAEPLPTINIEDVGEVELSTISQCITEVIDVPVASSATLASADDDITQARPAVTERRRRRRRQENSQTHIDEVPSMKQASSSLEAMERLSSDATREHALATRAQAEALREHARSTDRLASAIERLASAIEDDKVVKKRFRRISE